VKRLPTLRTLFVLIAVFGAAAHAQQRATLTEAEADKLRDTQGAGDRIKLYLDFMQARLSRFDGLRNTPLDPELNTGSVLEQLMKQYVELDDELKDWIQYQYNHQNDMRAGLRDLLDRGSRQLQQLRHVQQSPDPYAVHYSGDLQDAIANMQDTLNGGSAAIAGQVKAFGELKQEQKESAAASKQAIRDQKKQLKEERKLAKKEEQIRKKEEKKQQQENPNSDDNN
jgi:hypothetical protein